MFEYFEERWKSIPHWLRWMSSSRLEVVVVRAERLPSGCPGSAHLHIHLRYSILHVCLWQSQLTGVKQCAAPTWSKSVEHYRLFIYFIFIMYSVTRSQQLWGSFLFLCWSLRAVLMGRIILHSTMNKWSQDYSRQEDLSVRVHLR